MIIYKTIIKTILSLLMMIRYYPSPNGEKFVFKKITKSIKFSLRNKIVTSLVQLLFIYYYCRAFNFHFNQNSRYLCLYHLETSAKIEFSTHVGTALIFTSFEYIVKLFWTDRELHVLGH